MKVHLSPKRIKAPVIYVVKLKQLLVYLDTLVSGDVANDNKSSIKKEISVQYKDQMYQDLNSDEVMDQIGRDSIKIVSFEFKYSNSTTKVRVHACVGCGMTIQVRSTIKGMAVEYEEKIKSFFNQDSFNWLINNRKTTPVISFILTLGVYFKLDTDKYVLPIYNFIFSSTIIPFWIVTAALYLVIFIVALVIIYNIVERFYRKIVVVDESGQKSSRIFREDILLGRFFVKQQSL